MTDTESTTPVQDLLDATGATRTAGAADAPGRFAATAPDWFGPERVFGGVVVAQAVSAAAQTVAAPMRPHSLHAYFLGALRPGPVELEVQALRDGRTFRTRHVTSQQHGRTALWCTVSFHADEPGDSYQLTMPEAPPPVPDPRDEDDWQPPLFDFVELGPSEQRADGTYRSTRRAWVRTIEALPDDPRSHLQVAAYLSDMTGSSFRPHSLGEWGLHTDASIDHAVWFHHPFRVDQWVYMDFHAVVNGHGRSTIRGEVYDRDGRLCLSMAQELLIRELDTPMPR